MLDFLGIGAQKAGTTWIYHHLASHPQICFPAGKEVHFWDRHRDRGTQWWLSLFEATAGAKTASNGREIRRGEITPAYSALDPFTVAEIAQLCPRARIFYSLRNPVARAWSAALMDLEQLGRNEASASDTWFVNHFLSHGSRIRGDYASCIRSWRLAYPRNQLHVILFDDIPAYPRRILSQLAVHLDIDVTHFEQLPDHSLRTRIFAGSGIPPRRSLLPFLHELYIPQIDALANHVERNLDHWKGWGSQNEEGPAPAPTRALGAA